MKWMLTEEQGILLQQMDTEEKDALMADLEWFREQTRNEQEREELDDLLALLEGVTETGYRLLLQEQGVEKTDNRADVERGDFCRMEMTERIRCEYDLFYLGLCGTSREQVIARAKEIYYKQRIKNELLKLLEEEPKALEELRCMDNIIDYIYLLFLEDESLLDSRWIREHTTIHKEII